MRNNDRQPRLKPITRIELSQANITLRVILIILALVIGISALSYALTSLLNSDPGWREVEISTSERNFGEEFTLQYYLGASGVSATAENKQLSVLYTEAMEKAYVVFSKDESSDTVRNLHYLNAHVNEDVEVDPLLYQALSKVKEYDSRYLFLAPIYVEYNRMFLSENAEEAIHYDPAQNEELVEYISAATAFAADPRHIDLKLLDNATVHISVSEEYLAFADEYGIESFLDFSWMRNAFVVDYVAECMIAQGFRSGYIVSYDGFTRNLDTAGNSYTMNLFNRVGYELQMGGKLEYTKPLSIVFLRNYPMTDKDRWHYYSFPNGMISTIYLDPADGMSKSAVNNLVAYSSEGSCVDVLLQMAPVFIADSFDESVLNALAGKGVFSIWGEGATLRTTDVNNQLATIITE